MEFKTLFRILKKHLADGDDIPPFFRDLMAMITTVTEEEWGTSKDPGQKLSDETIRTYTKKAKLPKKLAEKIVYRLTPEILTVRINERPEETRASLANDLHGYDPGINQHNVAEKASHLMVDVIRLSAGLAPENEIEEQTRRQQAVDLKNRYGSYLLRESEGYCPFGCGRQLTVAENGKTADAYEVSLIDKAKPARPENLIALCPLCWASWQLDSSAKRTKELKMTKKILSAHQQSTKLLSGLPLEKGIVGVISRIRKLGEKELSGATYEPVELKRKISPATDMALYMTVSQYVTTYYKSIRDIMVSADKRGLIDYDEVQDQMHAFYRKLKKAGRTKLEIFTEISERIHRVTLQEDLFCQIVVAFFIEKCEVFDADTQ